MDKENLIDKLHEADMLYFVLGSLISSDSLVGGGSEPETVESPVISGDNPFQETTEVSISGPADAEIHYTTDGSNPTAESALYSSAFTLSDSATVKAIAIKNGVSSSITSTTFTKGESGGEGSGDIE